jgi:hypothetical protein
VLDQHHEFHRYVSFLLLGWAELSKQLRLVERSLHLPIERDEEKSTGIAIIFLDRAMRAVPGLMISCDGTATADQNSSAFEVQPQHFAVLKFLRPACKSNLRALS